MRASRWTSRCVVAKIAVILGPRRSQIMRWRAPISPDVGAPASCSAKSVRTQRGPYNTTLLCHSAHTRAQCSRYQTVRRFCSPSKACIAVRCQSRAPRFMFPAHSSLHLCEALVAALGPALIRRGDAPGSSRKGRQPRWSSGRLLVQGTVEPCRRLLAHPATLAVAAATSLQ